MWGIWCKDMNSNRGGWLKCPECGNRAVLAFAKKKDACKKAADEYGFDNYTAAKEKGWVEVRKLPA